MKITSVQNALVKQFVKLMNLKKERDLTSQFIVEGEHLVFEALRANLAIEVLVLEGSNYPLEVEPIIVTKEVMNKICDTINPQGIIARCQQKKDEIDSFNRVLLLDDVRDPGNLGTILRSADAFGFDGIIVSPNTVDLYNPKVIRATQGAILRTKVVREDLISAINTLQEKGVHVYAADLDGKELSSINPIEQMAFVMGNEAKGVSQAVLEQVDDKLTIEMTGSSESLNVSIAASIIMYQFRNYRK
jgi:RNA methyltransferase, TrmH family